MVLQSVASARATGVEVCVLPTHSAGSAAEAWQRAQEYALSIGWEWWFPVGDDDLVMPIWGRAFEKCYREGRLEDDVWRVTCSAMYLIDSNGVPYGVVETPPMGFHRTATVATLGGYVEKVDEDGSRSDVYLTDRANAKGLRNMVSEAAWYCYRFHGSNTSDPGKRYASFIRIADREGEYLGVLAARNLRVRASPEEQKRMDAAKVHRRGFRTRPPVGMSPTGM